MLAVLDGSKPLDNEDYEILGACAGKPSVAVINKNDLGLAVDEKDVLRYTDNAVVISAKDPCCYETLKNTIERLLGTDSFDTSSAMLINERQLNCCKNALTCIDEAISAIDNGLTMDAVNVSIDAAISPLLELTGEKVSEAVVNEVFSRFCVGK